MKWAKNTFIKNSFASAGFTLIEVMIVLALVSFLTIAVIAGSTKPIKNEQFSSTIRAFANRLRTTQVAAYTNTAPTYATTNCASQIGAVNCFYRGDGMYADGRGYQSFPYFGTDLSQYQGNTDQRAGIRTDSSTITQPPVQAYDYGLTLTATYSCPPGFIIPGAPISAASFTGAGCTTVTAPTISFLSPNAKSYITSGTTLSGPNPVVDLSRTNANTVDAATIAWVFDGPTNSLTGIVTFDASQGTINSKVE